MSIKLPPLKPSRSEAAVVRTVSTVGTQTMEALLATMPPPMVGGQKPPAGAFTAKDAAKFWGCERSTALIHLRRLVKQGKLRSVGKFKAAINSYAEYYAEV
jgi:hypothetical protein